MDHLPFHSVHYATFTDVNVMYVSLFTILFLHFFLLFWKRMDQLDERNPTMSSCFGCESVERHKHTRNKYKQQRELHV